MKRLIYSKQVKFFLYIIQALAAGGIVYFLISIGFWMEDSFSLSELSRSYEESELFFRQVDTVLSNKIRAQDNARLLETDGEFDPYRQIDIQSYNIYGNTVQDMNTTYLLKDLLDFCENGGWLTLHNAIETAKTASGQREAGEWLDEHSESLETITPVTGITLAECSRWYSDSAGYIEEMYTMLDEACQDLYDRYIEYTTAQEESWSSEAPSNLLYCIENTSTGQIYTNIDAYTYDEAVTSASADENFVSLYEGERSFNIMVTNPERVLNPEAAEWFLNERFVGTNEKVYLAVDMTYPASDGLQAWAEYYASRETIVRNSGIGASICLILLVFCFACSVAGAGFKKDGSGRHLLKADSVPAEVAAGIYLIVAIACALVISGWDSISSIIPGQEKMLSAVIGASAWLVFLSAALGLVRRLRAGTLWADSITRMLIRTWQQINSSRAASGQLLLLYIGFFVLNFLFLLLFGRIGLVLVVLLDMAVLLKLMQDMAGRQNIYEGIHQLSRGDLKYRIDTSSLQGETLEMAKAVNEMGDSLCEALESIVKNERLKAELITNVSHDLKTPLTSIVNYVDLIKRENIQNERVRQYIEILDQKSLRLKQLTEDLVEASKISSGNVELEISRIEVQSMLMQAIGEFEERLEEKDLYLSWNMEKDPVYIMADGRQLWRILDNLLGNIYKYAKEGTEVGVKMGREDGDVKIAIWNTSKEKITVETDELTGRFVRGDMSRSTEGSGLGLSIAQNLTELMDGRFELQTHEDLFMACIYFTPVS